MFPSWSILFAYYLVELGSTQLISFVSSAVHKKSRNTLNHIHNVFLRYSGIAPRAAWQPCARPESRQPWNCPADAPDEHVRKYCLLLLIPSESTAGCLGRSLVKMNGLLMRIHQIGPFALSPPHPLCGPMLPSISRRSPPRLSATSLKSRLPWPRAFPSLLPM